MNILWYKKFYVTNNYKDKNRYKVFEVLPLYNVHPNFPSKFWTISAHVTWRNRVIVDYMKHLLICLPVGGHFSDFLGMFSPPAPPQPDNLCFFLLHNLLSIVLIRNTRSTNSHSEGRMVSPNHGDA